MTDELPGRVLVVVAHPDDVDFGASGTIATWTSSGVDVEYVIVTDGDQGGFDREVPRSEMAEIRRAEQQHAAGEVGVSSVEFLGWPDGRVVADLALREAITRQIRRTRPDRVLCPSTMRDFARIPVSHPDHLAVGEATMCAIYPDARNPFAFPHLIAEGLDAHIVHEVWLMGHPTQDRFVEITEAFPKKVAALSSHKSQIADPSSMMQFIETFNKAIAKRAGFSEGALAEAFFVVNIS